ncbi:MAG: NCS2 family permease [Nitrospirota bacterium]|nr:NCS2 family permease [Nitrospirota bacterium]
MRDRLVGAASLLERFFHLQASGTSVRTEVLAGATTFLALSYILFVQPAVLSATGMDFGAVMTATCLASAFATLLMGLSARYPIALAPAMGHNVYFAFTVCGAVAAGGLGVPWQTALGAVFVSGLVFLGLSRFGFRERLLNAVPDSLKQAIAVGIGLLIAFVGLQWAGIVVARPGILVGLGPVGSAPVLLSLFGLLITAGLVARGHRAALLWGMVATTLAGIPLGLVAYHGLVSAPPSLTPTLLQLDLRGLLSHQGMLVIFVFFFLALFDTIGTLVGVSRQAGLLKDGCLPRAEKALTADAAGMTAGALLGTSTVTSYVESAAGVAAGGRTGLTSVVTAMLFLLALFFAPLAKMVGGGYVTPEGAHLYPVIAPALILVGSCMLRDVAGIPWHDATEAIPAFLTIILMPLTVSITDGIAFGLISYAVLKLVTGRLRDAHWMIYLFAGLLALRYVIQ